MYDIDSIPNCTKQEKLFWIPAFLPIKWGKSRGRTFVIIVLWLEGEKINFLTNEIKFTKIQNQLMIWKEIDNFDENIILYFISGDKLYEDSTINNKRYIIPRISVKP